MLRAIILALVLCVAFGTIVPIATENAEAGAHKQLVRKTKKKRRAKRYRRYITTRYTKRGRVARKYKKTRRVKKSQRYTAKKSTRRVRKKRRVSKTRRVRRTRRTARYRKAVAKKRYRRTRRKRSTRRYKKVRYTKASTRRTRKKRRVRKYSKKWWNSYRAKKNRQQAIARRKQNMRLRRIRLARQKQVVMPKTRKVYQAQPNRSFASQQTFVSNDNLPVQMDENVLLDVIGPAVGETDLRGRNKTVGGVSTTTLRRTVIDKMIQENGWVENDYQKMIGNKKVYVVVAKSSGKNSQVQARTFYFTESNGQIYRVSSKAAEEKSEQIARKSERMIQTLAKPEERIQQAQRATKE